METDTFSDRSWRERDRQRERDWESNMGAYLQKMWKSCFGVQLSMWLILPRCCLSYFWGSSCLSVLICWTHPQFLMRKFRTKCSIWVSTYWVTEVPANPSHSHLPCARVEPGVPGVPCLPCSTSQVNVFSADQGLAMWMSWSDPQEKLRAVGLRREERISGSSSSLPHRGIWVQLSGCR